MSERGHRDFRQCHFQCPGRSGRHACPHRHRPQHSAHWSSGAGFHWPVRHIQAMQMMPLRSSWMYLATDHLGNTAVSAWGAVQDMPAWMGIIIQGLPH